MWLRLSTYLRLGVANLFRVFGYRLLLKMGAFKKNLPIQAFNTPVLADALEPTECGTGIGGSGSQVLGWYDLGEVIPDWHRSMLTQQRIEDNRKHWSEISDFDSGVGDIKGVWEPSRMSWVLDFALQHRSGEDPKALSKLAAWLDDWLDHNPVNQGVNWKCAQETSLRVLHLAAATLVLDQRALIVNLAPVIRAHLGRILPTLSYAKAQDNNHGTSEGAALYIGGAWLAYVDADDKQARQWRDRGRAYLWERANRLIMTDGSFSQYSVTYHRLMLDTFSMVELWRRYLALPALAGGLVNKLQRATDWLFQMTDAVSGDAPNIGANDGAHILNFCRGPYRDFRPSVELAAQLFCEKTAFDTPETRQIRGLFALEATVEMEYAPLRLMSDGGYGVARQGQNWCVLRVPHFVFRPSQEDALHLDLWVEGENVLRDAGSYSYNAEPQWLDYFTGVTSHNTVEFDQQGQMPRISRFLLGNWLNFTEFTGSMEKAASVIDCAYELPGGKRHKRGVRLDNNSLSVEDQLSGVSSMAVLRWRLIPGDWDLQGHILTNGKRRLEVSADQPVSIRLVEGWESRFYGKKTVLPVLEVESATSNRISTRLTW